MSTSLDKSRKQSRDAYRATHGIPSNAPLSNRGRPRKQNRTSPLVYLREWRRRNPCRLKLYTKRHRVAHLAAKKRWQLRNPEKHRQLNRDQKARRTAELRDGYVRFNAQRLVYPITEEQLKTRIQIRRAQRLLKPMAAAHQIK